MAFWTIQHKKVIETLAEQGAYYPDFALSPQTHRATYDKLLLVYNEVNKTEYKGLLFCIAKDFRKKGSVTFADETEFFEYMKARPYILRALNNGAFNLLNDNYLLCKFATKKFDADFLCFVDFWNFILMTSDEDGINRINYERLRWNEPVLETLSYDGFVDLLWSSMRKMEIIRPLMSSTIFQYNIPYVEKDMLVGTYSLEQLCNV
jgi:hypothetical protein